jgi:cell division protein FtsI (penicillin-binding protein 3)
MAKRLKRKSFDWTRIRLRGVAFIFLCLLGLLWARAYQVQILKGPELARSAQRQYWTKEYAGGGRGEIFDRNGMLLAKSVQVSSVYTRPMEVRDPRATAAAVARILKIPEKGLYQTLLQKKSFVWIARKISDKQAAQIEGAELPGIHMLVETERVYPQGHLAGQLLGFVGMDNDGLEGLERSFDEHLKGERVKNVVQRDARGQILYTQGEIEGVHGHDLHLTIDSRIQYAMEEALATTVSTHQARSGMGMVVEVSSGEILAWANYPFFNPNAYKSSSPVQWRNRIALDALEPGSTMKPFLIAAALHHGTIKPESIFYCENGRWQQKGWAIEDTHKYEWLSVSRILSNSSNICAAKVGMTLGAETYAEYLRKFGFGRTTTLNLPGESAGVIRDPKTWYPLDLAAASFGQGIATSGLQLAQGFLCLARDGRFAQLKIVRGMNLHETEEQVVSPESARAVIAMMREAVDEGTGTRAAIQEVSMAGKTGTAQKAAVGGYGKEYVASFIGLIPSTNPRYLILVIVDEPKKEYYGGLVAAPAVRAVALQTLSYRGELPERAGTVLAAKDSEAVTRQELLTLVEKPQPSVVEAIMPDLRGMGLRQALEMLARQGVVPILEGSGMIIERQSPAPGRPAPEHGTSDCLLWLTDTWRES